MNENLTKKTMNNGVIGEPENKRTKKKTFFKKVKRFLGFIVFIVFMVAVVKQYLDGFDKRGNTSKKENKNILNNIVAIDDLNKNEVKAKLGQPNDIYKDNLYLYNDEKANYQIIIKEDVEKIIIKPKVLINRQGVKEILADAGLIIRSKDMDWKDTGNSTKEFIIYNKKNVKEVKVKENNNKIERIEIFF